MINKNSQSNGHWKMLDRPEHQEEIADRVACKVFES